MNDIIIQTAHMSAERIVRKCGNIRQEGTKDYEEIDFIHAWDELAGAYGILKDKKWNDNQIFKYLEPCKMNMIEGGQINFESIKRLK